MPSPLRSTERGHWGSFENRRRFMERLGARLGFSEPEDWYTLTAKLLRENGGSGILSAYGNSPLAVLEASFPEHDWKEWLFSQVPNGFWQDPAHCRRYLRWLGDQLGFEEWADWRGLTTKHLRKHRGSGLLATYGSSPFEVLRHCFPERQWLEWQMDHTPNGFWADRHNRRRYVDWLARRLGIERLDDWYPVRSQRVRELHGRGWLREFGGSLARALRDASPEHDWKEWLFVRVPKGLWDDEGYQRRYLAWVGEQLGFEEPADWYGLTARDLNRHHGVPLLKRFGGSPSAIVMHFFPEHDWLEWRFTQTPNGFWAARENRRRYMAWLGRRLGFQNPEDWYAVAARDFIDHHGGGLLDRFEGSPAAILADYLPDQDWQQWRFDLVPRGFWDERDNRRRYLAWLGERLGLESAEDWSRLRVRHLRANHGTALVKKFDYSIPAILADSPPEPAPESETAT